MVQLENQCLAKLRSETEDMIQDALSRGLTFCQLLDLGVQPSDVEPVVPINNVVQVVFQHVLQDKNVPKMLIDLVVNTLAQHLDPSLWEQLEPMISHPMSPCLINAMVARPRVKDEDTNTPSVKSESDSTGNGTGLFALNGRN